MEEKREQPTHTHAIICPYCSSHQAELLSLFGQQLSTMQYYCHHCHTPFEYVKDDDQRFQLEDVDASHRKGTQR